VHPRILRIPLGPMHHTHQPGLDRGQRHQEEVEELGAGSHQVRSKLKTNCCNHCFVFSYDLLPLFISTATPRMSNYKV